MCSGVVPQQPPMICAPAASQLCALATRARPARRECSVRRRTVTDLGIGAERSRPPRANLAQRRDDGGDRAVHDVRRPPARTAAAPRDSSPSGTSGKSNPTSVRAGAEPATHAEPHGQSDGAGRRAGERRMACLLHHLEHEQIDTGFGQGFGELEVRAALGALVGIRVHVESRRQARDRTGDCDLAAAHVARFARSRDGPSVDEREVIAMARRFEHEARRGERVRRDDVGTGGDIVRMDRAEQVVLRQRGERAPGRRG